MLIVLYDFEFLSKISPWFTQTFQTEMSEKPLFSGQFDSSNKPHHSF